MIFCIPALILQHQDIKFEWGRGEIEHSVLWYVFLMDVDLGDQGFLVLTTFCVLGPGVCLLEDWSSFWFYHYE